MKIAIAAAEAHPFAKVGGLGDVAAALPAALLELGHAPLLFLPGYGDIDAGRFPSRVVLEGNVPFFPEDDGQSAFKLRLHEGSAGYPVFFIESPAWFSRAGIYLNPDSGEPFADEALRFIFLNLALLESLTALGEQIDILHANDFHFGWLPWLLDSYYRKREGLERTATVFSIHNLAYQGIYDSDLLRLAGPEAVGREGGAPLLAQGMVNMMAAGIRTADLISTVSRRYAQEIAESDEYGCGLNDELAARGKELAGILNGVDATAWSPENDKLLARGYGPVDAGEGKAANKKALLAEAGLDYDENVPLFGIVSRLARQKGFDLFAPIVDELMGKNLQMIILGTGEAQIEAEFASWAERYPERIAFFNTYDNRLAHLIEAASDFFLMPSRYEPCGLNQMYSLRYGAIPVVRATGGLADTVRDMDQEDGNGFLFEEYDSGALLQAIDRAVAFHDDSQALASLRGRIMLEDHSWMEAARRYENLYLAATEKRAGREAACISLLDQVARA